MTSRSMDHGQHVVFVVTPGKLLLVTNPVAESST